MSENAVTVVRVYLTEGEGKLKQLMDYLHDTAKVRGVTVYRGISGFGASGHVHSAALIDTSLDLPVTIEFVETRNKAGDVMATLAGMVEAGHIVHWDAELIE